MCCGTSQPNDVNSRLIWWWVQRHLLYFIFSVHRTWLTDCTLVGKRKCSLNWENAHLSWMSWVCFCLQAEGEVTDCSTKTHSTWRLRPAGRTLHVGSPGTWPIGGSLPSPFLDRKPRKVSLCYQFLLLFSLGFLILHSVSPSPHREGRDLITGVEQMTKETSSGISQSQKTQLVPPSRFCK